MERMRLDRFFSSQEILSRRDVRGAVKHGRILVNGAAAKKPDMQIDVQKDQILLDATGRKNGRGAYLCPSMECFKKAVKGRGLERSFKMAIPREVYETLEKEMEEIDR